MIPHLTYILRLDDSERKVLERLLNRLRAGKLTGKQRTVVTRALASLDTPPKERE